MTLRYFGHMGAPEESVLAKQIFDQLVEEGFEHVGLEYEGFSGKGRYSVSVSLQQRSGIGSLKALLRVAETTKETAQFEIHRDAAKFTIP